MDDSIGAQLFVAVIGRADDHDLGLLSRLHATGGASYAVVMDTDQWAARSAVPGPAPRTAWLQARGWKAVTLGREGSVAEAWQELGR
jgi:hypothetical protein